jgi:hypothetical protein
MAEPTYDFPAVSDGNPKRPKRGETQRETLFEYDQKKDWKKRGWGRKIGQVRLVHADEDQPKSVEVVFEFDNGESVTYEGTIPGNGAWKGKDRLQRKEGPSRFKDQLDVESVNPKRWG